MVDSVQVLVEDAVETNNRELTEARLNVQEHIKAAFNLLKEFTEKANLVKFRYPDTSVQGVHADVEQDKLDRFLRSVGIREVIVMPQEVSEEGNKRIRRRNKDRPSKTEAWVHIVDDTYRL